MPSVAFSCRAGSCSSKPSLRRPLFRQQGKDARTLPAYRTSPPCFGFLAFAPPPPRTLPTAPDSTGQRPQAPAHLPTGCGRLTIAGRRGGAAGGWVTGQAAGRITGQVTGQVTGRVTGMDGRASDGAGDGVVQKHQGRGCPSQSCRGPNHSPDPGLRPPSGEPIPAWGACMAPSLPG